MVPAAANKRKKRHNWDALIYRLFLQTTTFCLLTSLYLYYFLFISYGSCPAWDLPKASRVARAASVPVEISAGGTSLIRTHAVLFTAGLICLGKHTKPDTWQQAVWMANIWSPFSGFVNIQRHLSLIRGQPTYPYKQLRGSGALLQRGDASTRQKHGQWDQYQASFSPHAELFNVGFTEMLRSCTRLKFKSPETTVIFFSF